MRDYLLKLFRHAAWANRRVVAALRAHPAAEAEALPLLAHVLAAEHVWLCRLQGREAAHAVWPALTLDGCAALAAENEAAFAAYLGSLHEDDLAKAVGYRNTAGVAFRTPVADILLHVSTHGAYHRGQVARAIGRAGGTPANTDYITFVREG